MTNSKAKKNKACKDTGEIRKYPDKITENK